MSKKILFLDFFINIYCEFANDLEIFVCLLYSLILPLENNYEQYRKICLIFSLLYFQHVANDD